MEVLECMSLINACIDLFFVRMFSWVPTTCGLKSKTHESKDNDKGRSPHGGRSCPSPYTEVLTLITVPLYQSLGQLKNYMLDTA